MIHFIQGFVTILRCSLFRFVHTTVASEKPHMCTECSKSFAEEASLCQHTVTEKTNPRIITL